MLRAEQKLASDGGMRDQTIVGADADGEAAVDHLLDGMISKGFKFRNGLQVGRGTDLDGDALVRNIFAELGDVARFVFDGLEFDGLLGEEKGAVTDPIGVALGNRLKDGFGAVGLAGMDGLP